VVVMPCSVVVGYRCCRGSCCIHQDEATSPWRWRQHYMASQPRRPQFNFDFVCL